MQHKRERLGESMGIVGKRLLYLRVQANLTQKQIAGSLNIAQQTYSHYETGKMNLPLRHLGFLCDYYHVSVDYILGLSPIPQPLPKLSASFTSKLTNGELLSCAQTLCPSSKMMLVDYVHYLNDMETHKAAGKCEQEKECINKWENFTEI